MQTSTNKRPSRQKDVTKRNQTKISGFFAKPKLEAELAPSPPIVGDDVPLQQPILDENRDSIPASTSQTRSVPIIAANTIDKEREIIVIEDSPVKPILPEIIDPPKKPLPNFSEPPAQPKPVKETKPVHPFFAAKNTSGNSTSKPKSKKQEDVISTTSSNQVACWPSNQDVHCGFIQPTAGNFRAIFPPRASKHVPTVKESPFKARKSRNLSRFINLTTTSLTVAQQARFQDSAETFDDIPESHRSHPAISRLFSPSFKPPSNRTWNDKYAPTKAREIVHNDINATYLQSWLKALEIQFESLSATEASRGLKRPRLNIQRDADKRARKRRKLSEDPFGLDDFIADDDDDDEEEEELHLDDDDEGDDVYLSIEDDLPRDSTTATSSPSSSRFPSPAPFALNVPRGTRSRPSTRRIIESSPAASPHSSAPEPPLAIPLEYKSTAPERPPFTERLTNTILLTGPSGSGKTAAVYACAQELDWKVFEFYPGIGKRSGAGFMNEVGGAGENHRVGGLSLQTRLQSPDTEKNTFSQAQGFGFLTSPSKKVPKRSSPAPSHATSERDGGNDVRQSLILVEEADILYQSDGNFWPTLVNFIRKSRRPVIITCNDVHLIPRDQLPLQSTLEFEPCNTDLATSYLQAMALAEGHPVTRDVARRIYENDAIYYPIDADLPDQPMPPKLSQGCIIFSDLKRAINELQFHCIPGENIPPTHDYTFSSLGDWGEAPAVMPEETSEVLPKYYRKTPPHEDLEQLLQLSELMDAISFSDAYVDRRFKSTLELESIDRYGTNADDVQGYTLLCKVPDAEEIFGVALSPRDEDMAVTVAYQARIRLEQRGYGQMARRGLMAQRVVRLSSTTTSESRGEDGTAEIGSIRGFNMLRLALRRAEYQKKIVDALDEKLSVAEPLLPRSACVLDYVPYMQEAARQETAQNNGDWMSERGARALVAEALVLP